MRSPRVELSALTWRKSTYSDGGPSNCLEVADGIPGILPVRDSKRPEGPGLAFPAAEWGAFVRELRAGRLVSR